MSHRLQVLIPEELDARIRKVARRNRISTGEWVRRAIVQALKEKEAGPDPLQDLARLNGPTGDIESMINEIEKGRE